MQDLYNDYENDITNSETLAYNMQIAEQLNSNLDMSCLDDLDILDILDI